jgi:hypothetical protein
MRLRAIAFLIGLAGLFTPSAHAGTQYVSTARWKFSYTNDGPEGIVLRNVWYTSPKGESAQVAQWLALEFFRVRYQDDAAGPYSDNFQLNSPKLYIGCPQAWDELPDNLCTVYEGGCEVDPTAPGCNDSSAWTPPPDGVSVCQQGNASGEIRLTAQGGYNCGQYRFIETFTLQEDGTIILHTDAKGIQATDKDGHSREHVHYAYYRLDIDADGAKNIMSIDGLKQVKEAAYDLSGLTATRIDGSESPIVFGFDQSQSHRSVWAWGESADPRDAEAHHGEATWVDWSRYDGWLHEYHEEELVGRRSSSLYGPPVGYCGGDEPTDYDYTGPLLVNREAVLNNLAATTLTRSGRTVTQTPGSETIDGTDAVLWINAPLYHDADPAATEHGCHDVEVRLRPSWGGCHPRMGEVCGSNSQTIQCDGSCL